MLRVTPYDIANYFQESVSFDFQREDILSFLQIELMTEDFYTLIDREAFSALLNDFLGYDAQLKNIFRDIFDSELGIHCFANQAARISPRVRITYFLNKHPYYQNDIAKVYLAFNSWLVFFNRGTLSPVWTRCPFCGDSVKVTSGGASSVCSNKLCKKTSTDFMKAAAELATLLAEEQSGQPTPTPSYWDHILENTEFYTDYKLPIENIRGVRARRERLEAEGKRRKITEAAVAQLHKIQGLLTIEARKKEPDFDSLLMLIGKNPQINEAYKQDNSFISKVFDLTEEILQKKEAYDKACEDAKNLAEFSADIEEFLRLQLLLEKELESPYRPYEECQELFERLDDTYNRISVAQKAGCQISHVEKVEAIKRYEKSTRAKLTEWISQKAHEAVMLQKQSELTAKTNTVFNSFCGVSAEDDKSACILKAFNREIEKNHYFDDYRVEYRIEYLQITNLVRVALSKLIKAENAAKMEHFKQYVDSFVADLASAQPYQMRSDVFEERLRTIQSTKYYDSIRTNGEYVENINAILEKITILKSKEKAYKADIAAYRAAKEKKKKHIRNTLIAVAISLIISVLCFFIRIPGGFFQ